MNRRDSSKYSRIDIQITEPVDMPRPMVSSKRSADLESVRVGVP